MRLSVLRRILPTTCGAPHTYKRSFHASRFSRADNKCGIVGLPNVGKSLLFNALLGAEIAKSANYPFATINPNIGQASVPDERLFKLAELEQSEKVVPARIEYVDIAGLVRGASEGKGLGNQFLENIRNVNMIVQLVRCFEDPSITHVEDGIDPVRDMQIIHDELVLKDYQVMEKNRKKKPKGMDFDERIYTKVAESTFGVLEKNQWAITAPLEDDVDRGVQEALKLITSRPMVICCNVDETSAATGNKHTEAVKEYAAKNYPGTPVVVLSAKLEADVAILEEDQAKRQEFLEQYGLKESGLHNLIRSSVDLLDLMPYYTVGKTETRAWPVKRGSTAKQCAGHIHTVMEQKFIKAETISYEDFISCEGGDKARATGKMRLEGPTYIAKEGDIFVFRFRK